MANPSDNINKLKATTEEVLSGVVLTENSVDNTTNGSSSSYPLGMSSIKVDSGGFPSTDDGVVVTHKVNNNFAQQTFTTIDDNKTYVRRWDLSTPSVDPLEDWATGQLGAKWTQYVNGGVPPTFGGSYWMQQAGDYVLSNWRMNRALPWILQVSIERPFVGVDGNSSSMEINDNTHPANPNRYIRFRINNTSLYLQCTNGFSNTSYVPTNWTGASGTAEFQYFPNGGSGDNGYIEVYWWNGLNASGTREYLFSTDNISTDWNGFDYRLNFKSPSNGRIRCHDVSVTQGSVLNMPGGAYWSGWEAVSDTSVLDAGASVSGTFTSITSITVVDGVITDIQGT